jgi:hypothetical protein
MAENTTSKLSSLWEKLAIGVLTLLLGLVQMQYTSDRAENKKDIEKLNTQVLELYRSSVTKQELKELEDRLTKNVEGIRSDIRGILNLYVDEGVRRQSGR